jgi:hypothetical protein
MTKPGPTELIKEEKLTELFPKNRDNEFFNAFYGGSEDGAFDIMLSFDNYDSQKSELFFEFRLKERPGKCMACHLTYGLPNVFEKSPIINLKGIIKGIDEMLQPYYGVQEYSLGRTIPKAPKINIIPLVVKIRNSNN